MMRLPPHQAVRADFPHPTFHSEPQSLFPSCVVSFLSFYKFASDNYCDFSCQLRRSADIRPLEPVHATFRLEISRRTYGTPLSFGSFLRRAGLLHVGHHPHSQPSYQFAIISLSRFLPFYKSSQTLLGAPFRTLGTKESSSLASHSASLFCLENDFPGAPAADRYGEAVTEKLRGGTALAIHQIVRSGGENGMHAHELLRRAF